MFRRAFWFTTGAAAGVWATTKVQRTLRGLAPDSLAVRAADRAVAAGQRVRGFALDVRAGMAQRERELTEALGIEHGETAVPGRALPPAAHRAELGPVTRDTSRIPEMRTTDGVG
ncbi:hypothetical protein E1265_24600 [Streptomyces sp. 8K308]|uniref:DUF6167 family protein n=1 Tax=Streptomyces sp. 8K308 TaxID=2530388 RepID=UPI00104D6E42|nr:DUF6167 family protein [Streptomyces sp. 8K308]TDC18980.1 hypothetical protein E1265_24600 [Streptomyces sp. 8K308]